MPRSSQQHRRGDDLSLLLDQFTSHTDANFHTIREPEAIRAALLSWYDNHRRMLPWRGDPPPWNGSTAAVNKNKTAKKTHVPDIHDLDPDHCYPLTAYGVWVSEIMCQQTRVEAVIPYWLQWMKTFPTVHDLAQATDDQVNAHWAGLGFYRRARLLHSAAKYVVSELNGDMPKTVDELLKLGGVGRYTACAIASIAFNVTVPVVDGNVCRVLSRLTLIAQHIKAPELKDKWAWHLAQQIVEAGDGSRAGCVNSALMELGATYCSPSGTGLDDGDPLKDYYLTTPLGEELASVVENSQIHHYVERAGAAHAASSRCPICTDEGVTQVLFNFAQLYDERRAKNELVAVCGHAVFPLPPPKIHKREEVYAVGVMSCISHKGDRQWLLVRRPKDGLLANQWEFPATILWNSDNEAAAKGMKRKDMSKQVPVIAKPARSKALDDLLKDLRHQDAAENLSLFNEVKRSHVGAAPIEHIFSHVRHTMWIEHAHVDVKPETLEWVEAGGRQLRWMSESDMTQVGVTSGVKKILKAIDIDRGSAAELSETKRRKR